MEAVLNIILKTLVSHKIITPTCHWVSGFTLNDRPPQQIIRHCGPCTIALISRCPCNNPPDYRVRPVIGADPKSLTTVMCHPVDESQLTYTANSLQRARGVPPRWGWKLV
ncbi:hypothetical protein AVEN_241456-1 [Araneus ventricosus]|uniref:Uncharacterized protein n=1 Tax=Araneus ventricosus TaxID=182803 RepID=A0A4Y2NC41_ARAVE|nr:hypothetical protein AVEN_241456-1 [Araneus ventricosus]